MSEFNGAPQWASVADAAICGDCGALVWNRVDHDRWHASLAPCPVAEDPDWQTVQNQESRP